MNEQKKTFEAPAYELTTIQTGDMLATSPQTDWNSNIYEI